MLSTLVQEAALEFGRTLRAAPVLAAYRGAAEALEADAVAQELLADLGEQQAKLAQLQRAALAASEQQLFALRRCQELVRGNATVIAYLRASNAARSFLPVVSREVTDVLGLDFPSLVTSGTC